MKEISYTEYTNLENCENEPLSFLGSIQPFGMLIVYDIQRDLVTFCSENITDELGLSLDKILGGNLNQLRHLLDLELDINDLINSNDDIRIKRKEVSVNNHLYTLSQNRIKHQIHFEFEELPNGYIDRNDYYSQTNEFIKKINKSEDFISFSTAIANEIRRIIDYDRVMVYKFDPDFNGKVIAESREEDLASFLGLNYPHTDIPKQARELYKKQTIRMLPNVNYKTSPIIALEDDSDFKSLDLSQSILRSVSPIHIEYLKNMGVSATLTMSIMINEQLWGLIACHNYSPKKVLLFNRLSALMQTEFYASQISRWERSEEYRKVQEKEHIYQSILEDVLHRGKTFESVASTSYFLGLTDATGGAILRGDKIYVHGKTPGIKFIKKIQAYMQSNNERVFLSNCFSDYLSEAKEYKDVSSGVLYFSLDKESNSAVIWFRKQLSEGNLWGGNPNENNPDLKKLTPRNSFKSWEENVSGKSARWYSHEIQAGLRLGNYLEREIYIKNLKTQKEQLEKITTELKNRNEELSQFNWISSHDMKEPLRKIRLFIDQINLEEQELSEPQKNYFDRIDKAADRMQQLINDLLNYAKLNEKVAFENKSLTKVIGEVANSIKSLEDDEITFIIEELGEVQIIDFQIAQLFSNLINNSIKFRHHERAAVIEVLAKNPSSAEISELNIEPGEYIKIIYRDNGIGFNSEYNERIFEVFQRLHDTKKFDGTGIGLAICKRIVETHQGFIRARGEEGEGAEFQIFLKKNHQ